MYFFHCSFLHIKFVLAANEIGYKCFHRKYSCGGFMHRILFVEDCEDVFHLVSKALDPTFEIVWCQTVADAEKRLASENFDLFILDITLPDGSGYDLNATIRSDKNLQLTPVIFLTAKDSVIDKVAGFSAGADDYISKPFELMELRARVEAKLKKQELIKKKTNNVKFGVLNVNLSSHSVFIEEGNKKEKVDLTPIEYKVLTLLLSEPNKVFSRDEILDAVWGKNFYVYSRSVDTHVSKLRKKLAPQANYIESVHGAGYKLTQNAER